MNFATNYHKPRLASSSVAGCQLDESWIEECDTGMNLKEGFHIEEDHEDLEEDEELIKGACGGDRPYLDLAAGAQVYMEKQMIHAAAIVHFPMFTLWKVCWWILCCPLYAPSMVRPTLRIPVLLFRRKWVLSRLSSYLYIRCSATSLKAYCKIWLTPGNWLLPEWFTSLVYQQALLCIRALKLSLKWSTQLVQRPLYRSTPQASTNSKLSRVASDSRLYHEINLQDPAEFPMLIQYSARFKLYSSLPIRPASRLWGRINCIVLPTYLRTWVLGWYVWMFGCDLDEAEVTDLTQYRNMREFFTRKLKHGTRPLHGRLPLVSPADGTVLYCGTVENDSLEQIKGIPYSMQSFLGPLTEPVFNIDKNRNSKTTKSPRFAHSRSDSVLLSLQKQTRHNVSKFTAENNVNSTSSSSSSSTSSSSSSTSRVLFSCEDNALGDNIDTIEEIGDNGDCNETAESSGIYEMGDNKDFSVKNSSPSLSSTNHAMGDNVELGENESGDNEESADNAESSSTSLPPHITSNSYTRSLVKHAHHNLQYCIIYLAPGDYHRFHSPADWTVQSRRHFSGALFSVKPQIARWLQGLFCINERAMYVGEWQYGFFSFTAVGATNVGSIHVAFDDELETSTMHTGQLGFYEDKSFKTSGKKGVTVSKGQDIGHFNLGSTIVLVFEAPSNFRLNLKPGQKVKYGQGIGGHVKHFE